MSECTPSLLARLQANEPSAWKEAFGALYPVAWRGGGHSHWSLAAEDREEAAADALAEVARRIHEMETWEQVRALTFVIARRKAVSRLRALLAQKRRTADGPDLGWDDINEIEVQSDEGVALAKWAEIATTLSRLIDSLGDPARALVRGYTLEGLSYEELALRHHLPVGTVGVILYRSMQRLRREVAGSPRLMKELSLYLRLLVLG